MSTVPLPVGSPPPTYHTSAPPRPRLPGSVPPEILNDPIKMCGVFWPDITLYEKQASVLQSVWDNYETTVHAANEVGKDFIASIATVLFFASRRPARVITSSSGQTQLKNVLWSEIKERIASSVIPFPWELSTLNIKRKRADGTPDDLSYVLGQVTNMVENFQGHHLDHDIPRVFCIFDECSGVANEFHEAAESWAHRILNIGNPMHTRNYFYTNKKRGDLADPMPGTKGLLSKVIHISGLDSPNVQLGMQLENAGLLQHYEPVIPGVLCYREFLRRKAKWDHIKQQRRLYGDFYEGAEDLMYPPDWLDGAEYRHARLMEDTKGRRKAAAIGVDCGFGRDLSCWTIIDRFGVIFQETMNTRDTTKIAKHTLHLVKQHKLPWDRVVMDKGSGGAVVVDHMRQMKGVPGINQLRGVSFGGSATPPPATRQRTKDQKVNKAEDTWTYKNKRAEMYDVLRNWLDPTANEHVFGIPEMYHELREELAPIPMWFDDDGKMYLPPKDRAPSKKEDPDAITIRKLIGRSPDRADSLVMACYALHKTEPIVLGAVR